MLISETLRTNIYLLLVPGYLGVEFNVSDRKL